MLITRFCVENFLRNFNECAHLVNEEYRNNLLLLEVILAYIIVAVFKSMAALIKNIIHMAVVLLKT